MCNIIGNMVISSTVCAIFLLHAEMPAISSIFFALSQLHVNIVKKTINNLNIMKIILTSEVPWNPFWELLLSM